MPLSFFYKLPCPLAAAAALCLISCEQKKENAAVAPAPAAPTKSTERGPIPAPLPQPPPPLKIATVDIARIFKESPRTAAAQKQQQADVVRVQQENSQRLDRIQTLQADLENLAKTVADPSVSDSKRQAALAERTSKKDDAIAFDRERREFLQRRQQALREKAAQQAHALLEEIRHVVDDTAREEGYDYVFDLSAQSNTGSPFMLVCRDDRPDLTDAVIEQIKHDSTPDDAKSDAGPAASAPLDK